MQGLCNMLSGTHSIDTDVPTSNHRLPVRAPCTKASAQMLGIPTANPVLNRNPTHPGPPEASSCSPTAADPQQLKHDACVLMILRSRAMSSKAAIRAARKLMLFCPGPFYIGTNQQASNLRNKTARALPPASVCSPKPEY